MNQPTDTIDPNRDDPRPLLRFVGSRTLAVAIGRFADIGAVVLTNMLLARWLSPSDFTSFLVLFNIASLLSICGTLGLNRSVVRFLAESLAAGDRLKTEFVLATAFKLTTVGALCAGGIMLVVTVVLYPDSQWMLGATMLAVVTLRTLLRLGAEVLRGFHDIRGASIFAGQNAGQASGPFADLLFLAFVGAAYAASSPSLVTVVLLNSLAMLCAGPALFWVLSKARSSNVPVEADKAAAESAPVTRQQMISVSLATLMTQVFIFTTWHSDLWLAELTLPDTTAPLYAGARTALSTVMLPLALINLAVVSSIPKLYAEQKIERLQQLVQMSATLAAGPALLAIALMMLFAPLILSVMFQDYYAQGATLLTILAAGRVVNAVTGPAGFVLMMTGHERTHLLISAAATALLWICGPLAARYYEAPGLAVASSSVFALHYLAIAAAVRMRLGISSYATWRVLVGRKQRLSDDVVKAA